MTKQQLWTPVEDDIYGEHDTITVDESGSVLTVCSAYGSGAVKWAMILLPADIRLCRLTSAQPQATVEPDWSSAPSWAMWWAVDATGYAYWCEYEPEYDLEDAYWSSDGQNASDMTFGGIPLGVDWRTLKRQRPAP